MDATLNNRLIVDDSKKDNWAIVEFVTDKITSFYVCIGNGYQRISNKCEEVSNRILSVITNDDDAMLLKKSNKIFKNGEFLGFDESKKFISSILNATA